MSDRLSIPYYHASSTCTKVSRHDSNFQGECAETPADRTLFSFSRLATALHRPESTYSPFSHWLADIRLNGFFMLSTVVDHSERIGSIATGIEKMSDPCQNDTYKKFLQLYKNVHSVQLRSLNGRSGHLNQTKYRKTKKKKSRR